MKINLRTLWTENPNNLPNWIWDCNNVIYKITNIITNKSYIGKTVSFYNRLVEASSWSHLNTFINYCKNNEGHRYLYNAIRKYHSRNFEVEILAKDCNDLNEAEVFWIAKLGTYTDGYNMTPGGESTDHLQTPEARAKKLERERANHGGFLAIQLPDSVKVRIEHSLATKRKRYSYSTAYMNTPECMIKKKARDLFKWIKSGKPLNINKACLLIDEYDKLILMDDAPDCLSEFYIDLILDDCGVYKIN